MGGRGRGENRENVCARMQIKVVTITKTQQLEKEKTNETNCRQRICGGRKEGRLQNLVNTALTPVAVRYTDGRLGADSQAHVRHS